MGAAVVHPGLNEIKLLGCSWIKHALQILVTSPVLLAITDHFFPPLSPAISPLLFQRCEERILVIYSYKYIYTYLFIFLHSVSCCPVELESRDPPPVSHQPDAEQWDTALNSSQNR